MDKGLVTPDPLGLGIRTGPRGEVLDRAGAAVPGAFAIGPWRVAGLWESSAVPELRGQAAAVAAAGDAQGGRFARAARTRYNHRRRVPPNLLPVAVCVVVTGP